MQISMAKYPGKILTKKHLLLAEFFGYSMSGFEIIRNIQHLMPPFFAGFHDSLVNNMA